MLLHGDQMADDDSLDSDAADRRRATKADVVGRKSLQSHGRNSKVYVPVILKLFQDR